MTCAWDFRKKFELEYGIQKQYLPKQYHSWTNRGTGNSYRNAKSNASSTFHIGKLLNSKLNRPEVALSKSERIQNTSNKSITTNLYKKQHIQLKIYIVCSSLWPAHDSLSIGRLQVAEHTDSSVEPWNITMNDSRSKINSLDTVNKHC